jgi:ribosomal protein L3 glutamine methyltransferase
MRSVERRSTRVRDIIRATVRRLRAAKLSYGHGTTNAHDEAVYLILHALHLPPDELAPHWDRLLTAREEARIEARVTQRIAKRIPAAYLTHEAWLGDFRFYVDERVIVPRSYIAELLRDNLAPWLARPSRIKSALDLCTGSGCLAILLAHHFPRAQIDASDISPGALAVARRNVKNYRLARRITLKRSNLFGSLGAERYDLIVSNPPYVTASAMRRLPREYRHEPAIAFSGGMGGLDLVRRIVQEAPDHLTPRGWLIVETGHARARVERAFRRLPFIWAETSGGADCVFLINREDLQRGLTAGGRAIPAGASPRAAAARSSDHGAAAAGARRDRSARASSGSR